MAGGGGGAVSSLQELAGELVGRQGGYVAAIDLMFGWVGGWGGVGGGAASRWRLGGAWVQGGCRVGQGGYVAGIDLMFGWVGGSGWVRGWGHRMKCEETVRAVRNSNRPHARAGGGVVIGMRDA